MTNRSWLYLVSAVRAVRDARGGSDGAACTLLCQACESGVVRSRKRPWSEQPDEPPEPIYDRWGPPIPKAAWQSANIDLEHGWLYLAEGELLRADVEINADDLDDWLDAEKTELDPVSKREGKRGPNADKTEFGPVPKRAGKQGPKPVKLESTKKQMREDLANKRYTHMELGEMKQVALAKTYDVSRETACKARDAVLSEFGGDSITDK